MFSRKAQVWSSDLALSLLIFSIASIVGYLLIMNMEKDAAYEDVSAQAKQLSWVISSEGYPEHWVGNETIRAGIMSGGQLSLRKARALASMDPTRRKTSLRVSDYYTIYFTNSSGDVAAISGSCAIGDLPSNPLNSTNRTLLPTMLISGQDNSLSAIIDPKLNSSVRIANGYNESIKYLQRQDVLIIDGTILNSSNGDAAAIELSAIADKGITFIIIGYPGQNVLGLYTNTTVSTESRFLGSAGQDIGFLAGDNITLPMASSLQAVRDLSSLPTNLSDPQVSNFESIAVSEDGNATIARWLYKDSQVYYFSTLAGTSSNGTLASNVLQSFMLYRVNVTWPECTQPQLPTQSSQVAHYERTLGYRDSSMQAHVIVWRIG